MKYKKNTILFTGGGSAGHVTPNLPLIKKCQESSWEVFYIGSYRGIEKNIISNINIPYFSISSGKLRRYFSWQNFVDPFKILWGILQSLFILYKTKPKVVFSKGGFVSFPVVIAAKILGVPSIVHESDLTVGLANKLCFPFTSKICLSFPETKKYLEKYANKTQVTGMILRDEALLADPEKGRQFCYAKDSKKILLIYGGSLGAKSINETVRSALPELLETFYVVHICGEGNKDTSLEAMEYYSQFEYINDDFYNVLACADLVISRSGANTLGELLYLKKPHILIPLSKKASRGEQITNAAYGEKIGASLVIQEEELSQKKLVQTIEKAIDEKVSIKTALANYHFQNGTEVIYQLFSTFFLPDKAKKSL